MTSNYQSSSPVRTVIAIACAFVFSATCVLGAIAPAHVQGATAAAAAHQSVA